MKTILITGGLGFIGSNFIQMILTDPIYKNIKIINIDNDKLCRNDHKHLRHIKKLLQNSKRYEYKNADICNTARMQALIYLHRPDKIIHFAAQTHVDFGISDPQSYTHTNIIGTTSLLIAASKYYNILLTQQQKKQFRFHHISTDQVFGDFPVDSKQKFTEESKYNPSSPYSATKAGADHLVSAWHRTYNLPISISNCSNNYGKYQDDTKLIPKVIKSCLNQQAITIHGSGEYIRDWIYVIDHCRGIMNVLYNLQITNCQTYLFGGNCQRSNIQIIDLVCQTLDRVKPRQNGSSYKELKTFIENRRGQDMRYAVDFTKAKQQLNWNPTFRIQQIIQQIILSYI